MNKWQTQTIEEVLVTFETARSGLTSIEAVKRLKQYGNNALKEKKQTSLFTIILRQFFSPFVIVLVVAALILAFLHEYVDAIVISAVLFVNTIIGVIQEGKAQNTLQALRKFTKTKTLVFRDGSEVRIDSIHVVPGDILVLRAGDKVPADARIIEAQNLRVNESALTGESKPVDKLPHQAENEEDKKGLVFKGTYVSVGSGRAVVTAVGQETIIGSLSQKLETLDSEVPLKKNIRQLSRLIIIGTLTASVLLFVFGLFAGYPLKEMFFLAVAVAVSVIPEGLPVVITLVLAIGVYRMGKRNALVKRMQAVEALGQADIVAVDKTGTITRNELMIKSVFVDGVSYVVDGRGYEKVGNAYVDGVQINPTDHASFMSMARIGILASDAKVYKKEESDVWEVIGDPTEAALVVFGQKMGMQKEAFEGEDSLLQDIPFSSERKYHAVLYKEKGKKVIYAAGAPEKLIGLSKRYIKDGKSVPMSQEDKEEFIAQVTELSRKGQRVLVGVTKNTTKDAIEDGDISSMTLVGIFGMEDAIREGVKESVAIARRSGVEIVMITGDFKGTAIAIAEQAGIFEDGDKVLTGRDIKALTEEELATSLEGVRVFARVTPEQKLMIVNAYKASGKKIAMTGDGVNDALSLVSADLGIGMGKSGTEVAKEAADIVLLDDDIKSILAAIEEGRSIYVTIRKVILYLFSTNLSELFVIVLALSLFLPLPLQPSQILWLNLITDGFLVLAFVFDPRSSGSGLGEKTKGTFIISRNMFVRMIVMASVMTLGTLVMFYFFYEEDIVKGWTVAMTTMAFFQWFNVWNMRSATETVFRRGILGNKYLVLSAIAVASLQLFAIYTPFMNTFLKTTPLTSVELALIIVVTSSVVFAEEIRKLIYRIYVK